MGIDWSAILTWQNIVDVLVVWFIFYELLMLIRGTRTVQIAEGIVVIVIMYMVANFFGLTMIQWLLNLVIPFIVIAAIVIFQPEIRRGLEKLAQSSLFGNTKEHDTQATELIKALDGAIQYMSKRRIGALICIQMHTGLEEFIKTGIPLDADVSSQLLINIFIPNTPLHDGAVIIKDGRIAAAACYLPLSQSNLIPRELGTRHRAAVGISEETDAITIVVSEETGEVSITRNNELLRGLTQEDYVKYLRSQLISTERKKVNPTFITRVVDWISEHLGGNN